MDEKTKFAEYELAEDVQDFIVFNSDVKVSPELKETIEEFDPETMLKVTKIIGSATVIEDVQEATAQLIESDF